MNNKKKYSFIKILILLSISILEIPYVLSSDYNCFVSTLGLLDSRSRVVTPNTNERLGKLAVTYLDIRNSVNERIIPFIEAKRLINQDDWREALRAMPERPHEFYGLQTIESYFEAIEFIRSVSTGRPLDSNLLKEIHSIATKGMPFKGFEGRRIQKKFDDGLINRTEFKNLLIRAYDEGEEISGISHKSLQGMYRFDPVDNIAHKGSRIDLDGERYFSRNELDAMISNPMMKKANGPIEEKSPGRFYTTFYYVDVGQVEPLVNKVLSSLSRKLEIVRPENYQEIVELVLIMEKALISIHPFLDGNGRSIRLFGDLILDRYNLPPSLFPNENDLEMGIFEALGFQISGMESYVDAYRALDSLGFD